MRRIRGKETGPEKIIIEALGVNQLSFQTHVKMLGGRPDIVFSDERLAVFVDGDFWHGWRFPLWKHKLSHRWKVKIEENRRRDQRNFRQLRQQGWKVVRIWEHQVEQNLDECLSRILLALSSRLGSGSASSGV